MWRWIRRGATVIVVLMLAAVGSVYAASLMRLGKSYDHIGLQPFEAAAFDIPLVEAERRARSLMCADCHQQAGQVLFKADGVGTLVTPNLTRLAAFYSDSELERLIRKGVKKDGTGALVMPAKTYAPLADEDVAAIITWLRAQKPLPDAVPHGTEWGPLGRAALAAGKLPFEVDHLPSVTPARMRPAELGRYLVQTTCLHCHQMNMENDTGFIKSPALAPMVKSYSFAQFDHLMGTGRGVGDRDLGIMSKTAREAFAFFTGAERKAIFDYLQSVPD